MLDSMCTFHIRYIQVHLLWPCRNRIEVASILFFLPWICTVLPTTPVVERETHSKSGLTGKLTDRFALCNAFEKSFVRW